MAIGAKASAAVGGVTARAAATGAKRVGATLAFSLGADHADAEEMELDDTVLALKVHF